MVAESELIQVSIAEVQKDVQYLRLAVDAINNKLDNREQDFKRIDAKVGLHDYQLEALKAESARRFSILVALLSGSWAVLFGLAAKIILKIPIP